RGGLRHYVLLATTVPATWSRKGLAFRAAQPRREAVPTPLWGNMPRLPWTMRRSMRRMVSASGPDALRPPDLDDRGEARAGRRMRGEVRVHGGRQSVERVAPERRDLRTAHLVAGAERRQLVRTDRQVQRRVGRVCGHVDVMRERSARRDANVEAPGRVSERR